jgi:hypothetical protein
VNPTNRVLSIDILRGLVVLLMLFVNDLAGVADMPAWLKHIDPSKADGMTLPDFVFPAFLFIVGLSIPFGIEARRARGMSWLQIWQHILVRTVSLLGDRCFHGEYTESPGRPRPAPLVLAEFHRDDPRLQRLADARAAHTCSAGDRCSDSAAGSHCVSRIG